VRRRLESWARPIAGLLALSLAVVGAVPLAAAETATAAPIAQPTTLAASASATVAAMPLPAGALAQATPAAQTSSTTDMGSKSFFKTGAGKFALVLMLAGTSYMVYSAFKDNDPVLSQFR